MLLVVWVCAVVPPVWVMAVGVGVSGFWWCCFQWWVAVVWASRRVPGVVVGVVVFWLVWVCFGVFAWLGVGESVWWFRMLMRVLASFLSFWFCFLVLFCLVNNGLSWVLVCWIACLWCVSWLFVVCVFCFLFVWCGCVGVFVGGVVGGVGFVLVGSAREG